jgi:hypothetical protein
MSHYDDMVCAYCGVSFYKSKTHECDTQDLKDNIDKLAELIEDQTAIISSQLEAQNGQRQH